MKIDPETGRTWADRLHPKKSRLGNKKEPYYETEEEMLMFKRYTYESLSSAEKRLYNQRHNQHAEIYHLPIIISEEDLQIEKDYLCYYNEEYWKKYESINKKIKTTKYGNRKSNIRTLQRKT